MYNTRYTSDRQARLTSIAERILELEGETIEQPLTIDQSIAIVREALRTDRIQQLTRNNTGIGEIDSAEAKLALARVTERLVNDLDLRNPERWIEAPYCTGSDLSGGLVAKVNFEELDKLCEQLELEYGVEYRYISGAYNTYGIEFVPGLRSNEIREFLDRLESYPCADDEALAEAEFEAEGEAYEGWVKDEFLSAISAEFDLDTDNVDDDKIGEAFEWAKEAANVYWQHGNDGASFDVDGLIEVLRHRNLLDALRERAELAGAVDPLEGFVPATPEQIEAARVNPALDVRCARCGEFTTRSRASSHYGSVHSGGPTKHTFIAEVVKADGGPSADPAYRIIDDGTLDTVTSCDACGATERWQTEPGVIYAIRKFYTEDHLCK